MLMFFDSGYLFLWHTIQLPAYRLCLPPALQPEERRLCKASRDMAFQLIKSGPWKWYNMTNRCWRMNAAHR